MAQVTGQRAHPRTRAHSPLIGMVKAPNIAHLSLLTSDGYNKKEANLKTFSQQNKVIIILYLHRVQKEKNIVLMSSNYTTLLF